MFGIILEYFFSGIYAIALLLLLCLIVGKRLSGKERGCLMLYVLYLSAMFNVVGLPGIPYVGWDPTVNLIPFRDFSASNIIGMALNAVMFAPLGFLLPAYFERYRHWGRTLAAGFFTSLTVELIQLFTFRTTDVDDLIMNTLGALLGFLMAKLIFCHRTAVYRGRKDWLELLLVNAIVLMTIVFVRYPLMEVMLNLLKI